MFTLVLTAALATAATPTVLVAAPATVQQARADTTFAVRPGGRLELDMMHGQVSVTSWDRDAIRIRTQRGAARDLEISRRGNTVRVETESARGRSQNMIFEITVPTRFSLSIDGVNVRATVENVQGSVAVENVEGTVVVRNVTGPVNVESVQGDIAVSGVRGDVSVNTTNQTVRLDDIHGNIDAETVNGSIVMRRIVASRVEANTVQGLVEYHGTLHDGGRYYLGTHNGRITMSVPENTNARISVSTHNGKVETSFPVQLNTMRERGEYTLTLGSGSARVELESFNGSVYLVRPGNR
jgi:DUF4097 and DUF4098 domain-containing protein YvlB